MRFSLDLQSVADNKWQHSRSSDWWVSFTEDIEKLRPIEGIDFTVDFGFFEASIPNVSLGVISSFDLFGLDEIILFSFYASNRQKYKRIADLGANIGVHSLVLGKLGFHVDAYEPDPEHTSVAKKLLGQLWGGGLNATLARGGCGTQLRPPTQS